jgi:hypothetical protein
MKKNKKRKDCILKVWETMSKFVLLQLVSAKTEPARGNKSVYRSSNGREKAHPF